MLNLGGSLGDDGCIGRASVSPMECHSGAFFEKVYHLEEIEMLLCSQKNFEV